jgi:pyruvate/2-oxoglutarate/acetoin dehydrogenase E1 component
MLVSASSSLSEATSLSYFDALVEAMKLCADCGCVFVGQGVHAGGGTTMSQTLAKVPVSDRYRLEFPVAEELQTGLCIGASLENIPTVCVFPRWNFVLRAADQIVNHLDRLPVYSGYRPKVIIRVAIPSIEPFYPGPQHDDDFTEPFTQMTRTIKVVRLKEAEMILPAYHAALDSSWSTILVEYTERYKNARAREV